MEIWVAIANGWSAADSRISAAEARTFAREHPEVVRSYETADGTRYDRERGPEPKTVGESLARLAKLDAETVSPEREDAIAVELVALLKKPSADPGAAAFLRRSLPEQCAAGTGRGIEALRAGGISGSRLAAGQGADQARSTRVPSRQGWPAA